jgi:transcriptional regulator with XRE-family HTH domain
MTDTLIGQRIAVRLEELGMLPTELASRCGVSRAAVSGWINGTTKNIRNDHLLMVADTLGLEIRWLISGKGPRLAAQAPPVNYDSQDLDLLHAPPEVKAIFRNILTQTQKH